MIFIHNAIKRIPSTLLELLCLFANAGIFFGLSYEFIEERFGREWVASVTLGALGLLMLIVWLAGVRPLAPTDIRLGLATVPSSVTLRTWRDLTFAAVIPAANGLTPVRAADQSNVSQSWLVVVRAAPPIRSDAAAVSAARARVGARPPCPARGWREPGRPPPAALRRLRSRRGRTA